MQPPAPRLRARSDPFDVQELQLLPPPASPVQKWKVEAVMRMYLRHQELKADLTKKKTRGVDATRFRKHLEEIPGDVRAQYRIYGAPGHSKRHAANGRLQCALVGKIDEALAAAMACQCRWSKSKHTI